MKLGDWPICTIGVGRGDGEIQCEYPAPSEISFRHVCGISLSVDAPKVGHNGRTVFESGSLAELAGAIVEHARDQHGIEIERDGAWYRSFTPDGKLWCESSSVDDYGPVDLTGMEGEDLEYWTAHNEVEKTLTYQRIGVYTISAVEEWKP